MLISDFASRLKEAMKYRNIKASELVRKSELLYSNNKINKPLTKPLVSNYLKGTYEAKQDNVYALSILLDVDEAWLMGYDVPMNRNLEITMDLLGNPVTPIPLVGQVKAGYDYLAQENLEGTINVDKSLVGDGSEYFALKVKGDSMSPIFIEGDIVIVKKQNDCENNEIAIVLINGDEGTIKKVRKTDDGIVLQPLNPNYAPMIFTNKEIKSIPISIIGVVKQLQREF